MKRIVALALSVIFVFSLTACSEENIVSNEIEGLNDIDLKYYADQGKIPEIEFKIGDSPDDIIAELEKKEAEASKNEHYYHFVHEGETKVLISTGINEYYYKNDKKDNGISFIVCFDDSFGFKLGDNILAVEKSLKDYDLKEEALSKEYKFFYPGEFESATVLKADFEKNTIMFIFSNNTFCASVIYSNENWK